MMKRMLGALAGRILRSVGYELLRIDAPPALPFSAKQYEVAAALDGNGLLGLLPHSKAKDGQDLVAAHLSEASGLFLDIGAYDGVHKSNTWMLEKVLSWDGIVVEPNPLVQETLKQERRAAFEPRAVADRCGESARLLLDDQRTRIATDNVSGWRHVVEVETVCLSCLLALHGAPQHIDYLSIDVEGSELDVLRGFPFRQRSLGLVTVEHNFDVKARGAVQDLLGSEGLVQILPELSRNEDWFTPEAVADCLGR